MAIGLQDSGANQVSRAFFLDKDSTSISCEVNIKNPNYTRSFGFTMSIYDIYGHLQAARDFVYDSSYGEVFTVKNKLTKSSGTWKQGDNCKLVISRSGPNNQEIQIYRGKIDTSGVGA